MSDWMSFKDVKPTSAKVDIKLEDGSIIIAAFWSEECSDVYWFGLVTHWRPSKWVD
jgi:hypothetical protein